MNSITKIRRQSRRALAPGIDHLESRQLLSTAAMPMHSAALEHPHDAIRTHHVAAVRSAHSAHRRVTDPAKAGPVATAAVTPATSTNFQVVAQFSNVTFTATAAIADNDIWAVGTSNSGTSSSSPVAVHFNGTSWSVVPTPTGIQASAFQGVAAVASNDVWAVGYQQVSSTGLAQPLIEHWDGTSWSVVPSPNLTPGGLLKAVTAISTNNVWAVGEDDNLSVDLVEHWDGTSWSVVSSPAFNGYGEVLYGISADASNDVWAVGDSPGVILHFNGTSWSRTDLPPARVGGPALKAVAAVSPSDVWAVGMVRPSNSNWVGLTEHWDGTNWVRVANAAPGVSITGIAAISASDIWAVGSGGIQNWNGTSWSLVSSLRGTGVSALSDGTVVLVGGSGTIIEN